MKIWQNICRWFDHKRDSDRKSRCDKIKIQISIWNQHIIRSSQNENSKIKKKKYTNENRNVWCKICECQNFNYVFFSVLRRCFRNTFVTKRSWCFLSTLNIRKYFSIFVSMNMSKSLRRFTNKFIKLMTMSSNVTIVWLLKQWKCLCLK